MNSVLTVSLIGTLLMRQSQGVLLLEILLVLTVRLMFKCMYIYQTTHLNKRKMLGYFNRKGRRLQIVAKTTYKLTQTHFFRGYNNHNIDLIF